MIEVHNIKKSFGDQMILKGISTSFEAGKTSLVIGQSGSGKTVFIKSLLGVHDIDSGHISFDNRVYKDLNNTNPNVAACHAGLECGIIGSHYPNLDMISFGLTITGAHSPDDRASIKSTIKFWEFLKEVLLKIPLK